MRRLSRRDANPIGAICATVRLEKGAPWVRLVRWICGVDQLRHEAWRSAFSSQARWRDERHIAWIGRFKAAPVRSRECSATRGFFREIALGVLGMPVLSR